MMFVEYYVILSCKNIYIYAFFRAIKRRCIQILELLFAFSFLLKLPSNLSHDFSPWLHRPILNPGRQIVAANHMPMAAAPC